MIKLPATRIVAVVALAGGLAITPMLDDSDEVGSTAGNPILTPPPYFRIQKRPGELTLSGHTLSRTHEQELLELAASSYAPLNGARDNLKTIKGVGPAIERH